MGRPQAFIVWPGNSLSDKNRAYASLKWLSSVGFSFLSFYILTIISQKDTHESSLSVPVNVILLGYWALADKIKLMLLGWDHPEFRVHP